MPHTSVLLSPFWESVDERWIGAALLVLSAMMLCSQGVAIARYKSRRMYLASITFMMLAAVLVAPLADAYSPRELQHWIMMPQTLETLAASQILWIGVTIFFSIKEELTKKSMRQAGRIMFYVKLLFIRSVTALPSPIFLLFLVWVEQNLLMTSTVLRPQIVGLRVGGVICGFLTVWTLLLIFWLKPHHLIGLHLLIGCFLLTTSMLLPCLTQKMNWQATTTAVELWMVLPVVCLFVLFTLIGIFVPKKLLIKRARQ